jgi:hypothetical protein
LRKLILPQKKREDTLIKGKVGKEQVFKDGSSDGLSMAGPGLDRNQDEEPQQNDGPDVVNTQQFCSNIRKRRKRY